MTRAEKRMLRAVRNRAARGDDPAFIRGSYSTRIALALVRRRLLHAAVSQPDPGTAAYPWGEIAISPNPSALAAYPDKIPERRKIRPTR